jgi:hypothetical protein
VRVTILTGFPRGPATSALPIIEAVVRKRENGIFPVSHDRGISLSETVA